MKRRVIICATLALMATICWLFWPTEYLTDELIAKVTSGMSLEKVKEQLGEPIQWECYSYSIVDRKITADAVHLKYRFRPTQLGSPTILLTETLHKPRLSDPICCFSANTTQEWLGRARVLRVTFYDGKVVRQEVLPATVLNPLLGWIENKY